ncbi:hypothetical protein SAMN06265219_11490 [Gracilimonas mengyeensis]|uniref:Long-chain fatty acid transport protein n=2 Tax=Gracilimonas mengyeensis TaxID=1302730 RepID=A0A521F0D4_9BACT|nr:hypothetical protein SAMN06265219_11490 [Gracilimonas mengyeensis]
MAFGWSADSLAQLNNVAFPFSYLNTNIKSLSLGNATVSLNGIGHDEITPAVAGEKGVIQVAPIWRNDSWTLRKSWKTRGLKMNYRTGSSNFGFSFHHYATNEQESTALFYVPFIYKYNHDEIHLATRYSYSFQSGLTVGTGLNYMYSSEGDGYASRNQKTKAADAWTLDIGANYQFSDISFSQVTFQPHVGIALTDFGMPSRYVESNSSNPMPATLRIGGGTNISFNKKVDGREVLELSVMQNVSKIMARTIQKPHENEMHVDAMNPFKALIKSWGAYEYVANGSEKKADLAEQLWWHSGMELVFLESIAVRLGYQKAGKAEEQLSYWSLGAGIDLYYVVLDYTHINIKNYNNVFLKPHWQITGRIPLDGQRPDTILDILSN